MSAYNDATDAYVSEYTIDDTNYASIGDSTFNAFYGTPSFNGYMYNKSYDVYEEGLESGALMGNDVSYSNGTYTLLPAQGESVLGTTKDNSHHYTCNNTTGTCSKVRFYHTTDEYIELEGGVNIDDAVNEMLYADNVNRYNSSIKGIVDAWYAQNLSSKTNQLEDTVFCNARNMLDQNTNGWNKNGRIGRYIQFKNEDDSTDMTCLNLTDQFAVSNNKAKLTYPIGLLQNEEFENINTPALFATGNSYWTMSPTNFTEISAGVRFLDTDGAEDASFVGIAYGTRPVVSLASFNQILSGTGSETDPWIIE